MSEEHAYGHRTDFDIEFGNVTKEELWELYKLTKKKLDQEIKDHKDTNLELQWEIDIVRRNHQKTKPWVEEVTAMAQKYQELVNDTKTKTD